MTHPLFTTNINDLEMWFHNARQAKIQQHLSHPENRIRYAIDFLDGYVKDGDEEMKAKCYNGIAKYSEVLDYSEAHY